MTRKSRELPRPTEDFFNYYLDTMPRKRSDPFGKEHFAWTGELIGFNRLHLSHAFNVLVSPGFTTVYNPTVIMPAKLTTPQDIGLKTMSREEAGFPKYPDGYMHEAAYSPPLDTCFEAGSFVDSADEIANKRIIGDFHERSRNAVLYIAELMALRLDTLSK